MKYLVLIFLFMSCSDRKYTDINETLYPEFEVQRVEQGLLNRYQNDIDIMVAFLWPKEIKTQKQKDLTEQILTVAKNLRFSNDELLELNQEFARLQCNEVMTGEITVDIDIEDQCYDLSDEKDSKTQALYQHVIMIEQSVKDVGGEWLANHRDFYSLPVSSIDLTAKKINFTALGSYGSPEKKPYSYLNQDIKLISKNDYNKILFRFDRQLYDSLSQTFVSYGYFTGVVNIQPLKNSVVYQGELDWHFQGERRQGVIYWQNLSL